MLNKWQLFFSLAARNKLVGLVCGYYISIHGPSGSYEINSINISSIVGVEKQIRCAGCLKRLENRASMNRIDCHLSRINRTIAAFVHQAEECDKKGKDFVLFLADLIAPL